MIAPTTIDELREHLGEVGASHWHPVTQEDDTDVVRARETPLGGTIAHGFYTVSLAPKLLSLDSVAARRDGADVATTLTFERAGGDRPVCVARLLIRVRS